eukprot:1161441-Pelagomonas_calceolata.AAC.2
MGGGGPSGLAGPRSPLGSQSCKCSFARISFAASAPQHALMATDLATLLLTLPALLCCTGTCLTLAMLRGNGAPGLEAAAAGPRCSGGFGDSSGGGGGAWRRAHLPKHRRTHAHDCLHDDACVRVKDTLV